MTIINFFGSVIYNILYVLLVIVVGIFMWITHPRACYKELKRNLTTK